MPPKADEVREIPGKLLLVRNPEVIPNCTRVEFYDENERLQFSIHVKPGDGPQNDYLSFGFVYDHLHPTLRDWGCGGSSGQKVVKKKKVVRKKTAKKKKKKGMR